MPEGFINQQESLGMGGAVPSPVAEPLAPTAQAPTPEQNQGGELGDILFEDYFPPLNLKEEDEKAIAKWFTKDLKRCVNNVNTMKTKWAMWRATFMLEYVDIFYPDVGLGANFSSGLLCEKVLEALDRLRKGIFSPRPYFVVDDAQSNIEDINFMHRAEWFLHTVMDDDLDIKGAVGPLDGLFDFVVDGSLIMEIDQMYERVPQRNLKTYTDIEQLMADEDKVVSNGDFEEAVEMLIAGEGAVRVLIEQDLMTKNGLAPFIVAKVDHLVPPNVFKDKDLRFRGRRMYLTESDLNLLSSKGVNWYEKKKVNKVLNKRLEHRGMYVDSKREGGTTVAIDELTQSDAGSLMYDWRHEEDSNLGINDKQTAYKNTFAVYRVTCKYGYKTKSDPKGLIPKYCVFDFEPESQTILRARTYPHFHEKRNWFHFKLGFAPKSYWGFGFGARLMNEDMIESNAINLYLNSAAIAIYKPILSVHPEHGGMVPFKDGFGPMKIGYVRSPADIKIFDIPPPTDALIRTFLPLTKSKSESRTGITEALQGKSASNDPRAPAAKQAMMLQQSAVSIESLLEDWNSPWERMADFVWKAKYEQAVYEDAPQFDNKIKFGGVASDLNTEGTNTISVEELSKELKWKSQAASEYLNSGMREQNFLKRFQFFMPLFQQLASFNPELFKKYFLRWMRMAGQELNVRNYKYLIPTEEELAQMAPEQMMGMAEGLVGQMRDGQSQGQLNVQGGKNVKSGGQS